MFVFMIIVVILGESLKNEYDIQNKEKRLQSDSRVKYKFRKEINTL